MNYPGGYQLVDLNGAEISTEQATTITNAKAAQILRATEKPVQIHNAVVGAMNVSALSVGMTDTGALDGKVRYFRIGATVLTVSTDDSNITFTPA